MSREKDRGFRQAGGAHRDTGGESFAISRDRQGRRTGTFPALRAIGAVAHSITTCDGPDFGGPADGKTVSEHAAATAVGLGLAGAAWTDQVHGSRVSEAIRPGLVGPADGLWTAQSGLGLLGRSADCPLVLLAAPLPGLGPSRKWLVGLAHASWRSTAAGVTGRVVRALLSAGAEPESLVAAIGPSAGPCCYEVGDDVRAVYRREIGEFATAYFRKRQGRWRLDLWAANRDQLERAGVPAMAVQTAGVCTICHHDTFPSHRAAQGRAGRFAAVIGVTR